MEQRQTSGSRFVPIIACLVLAGCFGDNDIAGAPGGNQPPPGAGQPSPSPTPPPPPSPPPDTNAPPTISGSPPTSVTVGEPWTFQPSIADPDGDQLTVSASNLPGWLSLDASTGRVHGTPGEGDVRSWNGIALTVSDGQATASLSAFSVNVVARGAVTGNATLSWSAPTERADGSPIGELAGYEVLYGQQSRNYDIVIELDNPGVTRYMIEGLGPGTWFFAVKAVTKDGLESAPSQEVSKTIG
ncbi:putative Ig domain-containing protein [Wenzhouxiangella sp. XN24]|uniref:putative Ig domain-containing protein n=1 Tax=Wenzhouxiangella sp. XN24 TaxID=2713569 RepID=UPI0013ED65F4|nr:putative Ig domain-containing protein [Wenzhouxiangella sp. XN24]NGX16853.1 hypothetical protein [Wenzhouxiangella sp. XN24]